MSIIEGDRSQVIYFTQRLTDFPNAFTSTSIMLSLRVPGTAGASVPFCP